MNLFRRQCLINSGLDSGNFKRIYFLRKKVIFTTEQDVLPDALHSEKKENLRVFKENKNGFNECQVWFVK